MAQPNATFWAECDNDIKTGLGKGEVCEDQITGFEGAALTSDKTIKITTLFANNMLPVGEELPRVHSLSIELGEGLQAVQLPSYSP